jgi:predicted branched-subunit amino acid permease
VREDDPRAFAAPARAYLTGAQAVLPFMAGTVPFGMVTGVATRAAGLTGWEAAAMTVMVFAGTAQIAALPLLVAGAPAAIIIATAFIVNLRFVIYSAGAVAYFGHLPWRWRLLLGYFMTDTGYALFARNVAPRAGLPNTHWYFLGGGNVIALVWCGSALLGIVAGSRFPPEWQLEFAATLGLLALLAPFVRSRAEFAAALTAGVVALGASGLPLKLGLLVGALAGIAAGAATERMLTRDAT